MAAAHCTLLFSEMTVIYYRSFSDLLTERSPTVTPADLRLAVLHSRLNQSTHYTKRSSWTLSTLDRAWPPELPALSNSVFPSIIFVGAVIKRFSCYFYSCLCIQLVACHKNKKYIFFVWMLNQHLHYCCHIYPFFQFFNQTASANCDILICHTHAQPNYQLCHCIYWVCSPL